MTSHEVTYELSLGDFRDPKSETHGKGKTTLQDTSDRRNQMGVTVGTKELGLTGDPRWTKERGTT